MSTNSVIGLLIPLLTSIIFISSFVQKDDPKLYCAFDQKIYLEPVVNKLVVRFKNSDETGLFTNKAKSLKWLDSKTVGCNLTQNQTTIKYLKTVR